MQPSWFIFLSSLGFLSFFKLIFTFLKWVFITFLRSPKNLKNYGSWALITGATDGIGKAFAFQLAQKGLDLILVSRNLTKLKQVSNEIVSIYPTIKIKILVVDFSCDNVAIRVREMKEVIYGEKLDVGVLVNNVGVTYDVAEFFHEVEEDVWMKVMKVNVEGTSLVTKAVIEGMIERKRGAIVNIGSGAAIVVPSHPLYAIYAASKAYVDQLSRSLYVEYKYLGIDVQCQFDSGVQEKTSKTRKPTATTYVVAVGSQNDKIVGFLSMASQVAIVQKSSWDVFRVPLYVSTKMASQVAMVQKSSLFIPTADEYVKAAIRQIGYEPRCTPYWAHSLQWFFASLVPGSFLDAWRLSIGIRRRGHIS